MCLFSLLTFLAGTFWYFDHFVSQQLELMRILVFLYLAKHSRLPTLHATHLQEVRVVHYSVMLVAESVCLPYHARHHRPHLSSRVVLEDRERVHGLHQLSLLSDAVDLEFSDFFHLHVLLEDLLSLFAALQVRLFRKFRHANSVVNLCSSRSQLLVIFWRLVI